MPVHNYSCIIVQQLAEAQRKLGIIPGAFLPVGGPAGFVLTKNTAANYDVIWAPPGAPTAGNGIVVVGNTVHFAQVAAYTAGAVPFATGAATMGFDPANFFWDAANARLGLGLALPTDRLHVFQAYSDVNTHTLVQGVFTTDTVGGNKRGINASVSTTGAAGPWNAGLISGGAYSSVHDGSGATTSILRFIGLEVYSGKGAAGTGNMAGHVCLYVQSLNQNAIGTITDAYEIYIPAPVVTGAITNNYSIYQVSTSAFNFFGGNVAVNTATFDSEISVRIERAFAVNLSPVYGVWCSETNSPGAGTAQIHAGGYFAFNTATNNAFSHAERAVNGVIALARHNGTATATTCNGVVAHVNKANTGVVSNAVGVRAIIDNNIAGTQVTNGYVFFAQSPVGAAGFGAWYGVYVQSSGVTNGYGVYQVGTLDHNFFAGNTSLSTATFSDTTILRAQKTFAVTAAAVYGSYFDVTNGPAGAQANVNYAGFFQMQTSGAQNFTGATAGVSGVVGSSYHGGTGTVTQGCAGYFYITKASTGPMTSAIGVRVAVSNSNATNAITTGYGIYIAPPVVTGTITTYYGLYVDTPAGSTNYGIAILGNTALNYIYGYTAIGTNAPVNTAWLLLGASTATITSLRIPRGTAAYGGTVEGDFWNDFTQQCLIGYIDGLKQYDVRDCFVQTADQDVTNTNAATTMFGAGIGTLTFPANFFVAGKTVRITMAGIHSWPAAGPTLTFRVLIGGVTWATSIAFTDKVETNRFWRLEFLFTIRTTGLVGTGIGQGNIVMYETAGGDSDDMIELPMTAVGNINTTIARTLDCTCQPSAANANQHWTTTNATVEIIA